MALKFNLDSLEGLNESIAKLYKKKSDGKFQLAVEGLPPPEDTAGLKAAATWKARSHEATYHLSPEQLEILKLARGAASAAMSRVRKSGIQFDRDFKLGIVDVLEKQGWRCALTGIAFNSKKNVPRSRGARLFAKPGSDQARQRIRQGKRSVVSLGVNRAKGRMPNEHFMRVFSALGSNIAFNKNEEEQ